MSTIFTTLKPYIKQAVAQNAHSGLPVMRPLFLHYEADARTYTLKYQYLLGRDLLVAPVYEEGRRDWSLYLPEDRWVNMWTGETLNGGDITVAAPMGQRRYFIGQTANGSHCLLHYGLLAVRYCHSSGERIMDFFTLLTPEGLEITTEVVCIIIAIMFLYTFIGICAGFGGALVTMPLVTLLLPSKWLHRCR